MKAYLKNYRQSPRKVRLIADLVRGKSVEEAYQALEFLPKRAAGMFKKLLTSAVANAEHNFKVASKDLKITAVTVTKGPTLKRFRPVARGRASRINKRMSIIELTLGTATPLEKKAKKTRSTQK